MSLKVRNTIPRRLYKGNNLVTRVYKGDTLQWERMTREGRSFVSPADGEVSLDTIYGESLVWNQMVPDAKIDVPIGTYNYASYATGLAFTNGHKYIVALDNSELLVRMIITGTSYTSTAGQKILVTFTGTTGTGSSYQIQLSGTSTKVSHIKMHDLTLMFGVGNEPSTVEEFEALFPDSYYPYDAGSVLSLGSQSNAIDIDVKGFNLWDEELQRGKLIVNDGAEVASTSYGRSDYFKLEPDTNYYMYIEAQAGASNHNVLYYDENKNYLGRSAYGKQMQFTTPSNCYYGRIAINTNLNWTLAEANQFKCCINISNPTYNGQYKPYQQEKTVNIPLTTLTSNGDFIFPDGICGIGTARDEVGENKVIKRIGKVDLGTLDWAKQSTIQCFYAELNDLIYKTSGSVNMICNTFVSEPNATTSMIGLQNNPDKIRQVGKRVCIYSSQYNSSTPADFKSAMSGVMLYYELAEPIEYPLDIPFKVEYKIVEGGSESLVGLTSPIKEDIALNYK